MGADKFSNAGSRVFTTALNWKMALYERGFWALFDLEELQLDLSACGGRRKEGFGAN